MHHLHFFYISILSKKIVDITPLHAITFLSINQGNNERAADVKNIENTKICK